MATQYETTVSATEFKAKCLELMAQVHSGALRRVHVTKRGKPFVAVTSEGGPDEKPWTPESIFGCMKGTVHLPEDFDWQQSPYTDADLDEMDKRFEEKFKQFL